MKDDIDISDMKQVFNMFETLSDRIENIKKSFIGGNLKKFSNINSVLEEAFEMTSKQ